MPIRCLIIDDEPLAITVIKQFVLQIPELELIAEFENPLKAYEYIKANEVDLVFLDIQMPLLSGIELIKNLKRPPKAIFTTAHRDYAIQSYELEVVDYLLKPIAFARFFKAINKYRNLIGTQEVTLNSAIKAPENDHIYVNSNKKFIKINFDKILYIESIKDYIKIITVNQTIVTKDRISTFLEKLPNSFLRAHRSYIVNSKKVTAFTSKDIEIEKVEIPIGESYKADILDQLKN